MTDQTKYAVDKQDQRLAPGLLKPMHVVERWQLRRPQTCDLTIDELYRRGEWVEHPELAECENEDGIADARVYVASEGWGAVIIVGENEDPDPPAHVAVTVVRVRNYSDEPTRAYLMAHGPHDGGDQ